MWELVFPLVPIESWIINTYEHSLLDGPGMTMYFLVYDIEIVRVQWMTGGCVMVKDWGGEPWDVP